MPLVLTTCLNRMALTIFNAKDNDISTKKSNFAYYYKFLIIFAPKYV